MTKNLLPGLGLGILSWKGYQSLSATLTSYREAGLLDLVAEKLLLLPEATQEGLDIAQEFSMPFLCPPNNLGILGGLKMMAEKISSPYLLIAENDYVLLNDSTSSEQCFAALSRALEHLKSRQSHVWHFRSLINPGQGQVYKKSLRYWPEDDADFLTRCIATARRTVRPRKAHRLKGKTVYTRKNPSKDFPDVVKQLPSGDYLVRSDSINWTNNLFIIERDFFLEQIIPTAEAQVKGRLTIGFPNIEIELNRSTWWKSQQFWVGISNPGMFSHDRRQDRGY